MDIEYVCSCNPSLPILLNIRLRFRLRMFASLPLQSRVLFLIFCKPICPSIFLLHSFTLHAHIQLSPPFPSVSNFLSPWWLVTESSPLNPLCAFQHFIIHLLPYDVPQNTILSRPFLANLFWIFLFHSLFLRLFSFFLKYSDSLLSPDHNHLQLVLLHSSNLHHSLPSLHHAPIPSYSTFFCLFTAISAPPPLPSSTYPPLLMLIICFSSSASDITLLLIHQ